MSKNDFLKKIILSRIDKNVKKVVCKKQFSAQNKFYFKKLSNFRNL